MSPQQLHQMLKCLKTLTDDQIHRLIEKAKRELLNRTTEKRRVPQLPWKKR